MGGSSESPNCKRDPLTPHFSAVLPSAERARQAPVRSLQPPQMHKLVSRMAELAKEDRQIRRQEEQRGPSSRPLQGTGRRCGSGNDHLQVRWPLEVQRWGRGEGRGLPGRRAAMWQQPRILGEEVRGATGGGPRGLRPSLLVCGQRVGTTDLWETPGHRHSLHTVLGLDFILGSGRRSHTRPCQPPSPAGGFTPHV